MRLAPGETVFVSNVHAAEPTMHRWLRCESGGRGNWGTDCGILVRTRGGRFVSMPLAHAERFARRCHRCRWD